MNQDKSLSIYICILYQSLVTVHERFNQLLIASNLCISMAYIFSQRF